MSPECKWIFVPANHILMPGGEVRDGRGITASYDCFGPEWCCREHGTTIKPLNVAGSPRFEAQYREKFASTTPEPGQCAAEVGRLRKQKEEWAERQRLAARRERWRKFVTLPRRLWLTLLGREHDACGDEWP